MTLVLDTSVVSALMRREPAALVRLGSHRAGDLVLCAPVVAEIAFGLERLPAGSHRRALLEAEYQRLRGVVLYCDWNEAAALEFGRQKARLERAGTPIGDMDVAIGSVASSLGAAVATRNVKHFVRMIGLRLDDWGTE